jgi:hypothetical protein
MRGSKSVASSLEIDPNWQASGEKTRMQMVLLLRGYSEDSRSER